MNKIKLICIVAVFVAGCSRSSGKDEESKPAQTKPPTTEQQPATEEPTAEQRSNPEAAPTSNLPPKPVDEKKAEATPPANEPAKTLPPAISPPMKEEPAKEKADTKEKVAQIPPAKPEIVKVEPAPPVTTAQQQSSKPEEKKPDLKPTVEPLPQASNNEAKFRDAISGVIGANERSTILLMQILSENNREKFDRATHDYVTALLSDRSLVESRVMSSQLALRKIAEDGLYDQGSQKRVGLAQAELDRQAAKNRTKIIIRDGIMIGVTSVAIGGVSGFRRVTRYVEPVDGAATAAARRGAVLETAQVDLKAMGFSGKEIDDLGLTPFKVGPTISLEMLRNTNIPGVRWAFLDEINHERAGELRAIVLNWNPLNKPQGSMVVSRSMTADEAASFERQVRTVAEDTSGASRQSAYESLHPDADSATPGIVPARTVQATEFSGRRALGYTLGSGVALTGAYWAGLHAGESYDQGEDLFLESLVPADATRGLKK